MPAATAIRIFRHAHCAGFNRHAFVARRWTSAKIGRRAAGAS
jgi:hypothetical protein